VYPVFGTAVHGTVCAARRFDRIVDRRLRRWVLSRNSDDTSDDAHTWRPAAEDRRRVRHDGDTSADGLAAAPASFGELLPLGGGDPIPLLKPFLEVGRRESNDIILRFPNVSGRHCELCVEGGYWFVQDLGSSNGTKVNGTRVSKQRLDPGDKLSVARHHFEINYDPTVLGAATPTRAKPGTDDIFSRSLLEAAGLEGRRPRSPRADR
jgi:pSer/pThr/pTyr-binding forkhead associated (FHA) protein